MPLPAHKSALQHATCHKRAALWLLLEAALYSVYQKRKEVEYNHA